MDLLHTRATNVHPVLIVMDLLPTRATNLHTVLIVMDLLHTRATNLHPVLLVIDLLYTRATNLHPVLIVMDLLHTRVTNLHPVLIVMDLLHTRATNLHPVLRTSCVFGSVHTPLKLYVLLLYHLIPSSHQALSKGTLLIIDIKLKLQCKVVENWPVDTKNVKTTRTHTLYTMCKLASTKKWSFIEWISDG